MPADRILNFIKLLEGASDESQAEMTYLALEAMRDTAAAINVCVDWADSSELLVELRDAVLDRMSAPAPNVGLPPGVKLPEEAPGAGDPKLEETAAADLTLKQEMLLFSMYRHELAAGAEDANDRSGHGSWTSLTEPPSLRYQELAVLGLITIEDASEPGKPQWLAMLMPAGQLRAHRIAARWLAELEDGNEGHSS
jgi:hypothetical protein